MAGAQETKVGRFIQPLVYGFFRFANAALLSCVVELARGGDLAKGGLRLGGDLTAAGKGIRTSMADAGIKKSRPLSPHLQIWKWGPHMLVSILHRVTGDGMAIVGLALLLWWLGALAGGADAYATFTAVMTSPLGYLVLVGISWAFFTHMTSGIRHFFLDIGAGFELNGNRFWSIASPILGVVFTAGFWALVLLR